MRSLPHFNDTKPDLLISKRVGTPTYQYGPNEKLAKVVRAAIADANRILRTNHERDGDGSIRTLFDGVMIARKRGPEGVREYGSFKGHDNHTNMLDTGIRVHYTGEEQILCAGQDVTTYFTSTISCVDSILESTRVIRAFQDLFPNDDDNDNMMYGEYMDNFREHGRAISQHIKNLEMGKALERYQLLYQDLTRTNFHNPRYGNSSERITAFEYLQRNGIELEKMRSRIEEGKNVLALTLAAREYKGRYPYN